MNRYLIDYTRPDGSEDFIGVYAETAEDAAMRASGICLRKTRREPLKHQSIHGEASSCGILSLTPESFTSQGEKKRPWN